MKKIILFNILFFNLIYSQQTPAPVQDKSVLFFGAVAHIGNGVTFKNSIIGFNDGVIDLVAQSDTNILTENIKKYDTIIDATNSHVYPGIIALNTNLGLVEIDAVRATVDDDDIGEYLPEIRSIVAYNAESKAVESMRPNGVLLAQVAPNGGIISGKSSVVQFDAWNWEDAVIEYDQGIHINRPSPYTYGRWWLGEDRGLKANNNYSNQIKELKDFFERSKANMFNKNSMNL